MAERSVLGAAMLTDKAAKTVVRRMRSDDFVRQTHREIFAAMCALVEEGKPVDLTTLCDAVESAGLDYLMELGNVVPSAANVDYYIEQATNNARELRVAERMRAIDKSDTPRLTQLELLVATEKDRARPVSNAMDTAAAVADYMDAIVEGRSVDMITTGIASYDAYNGGLPRGSVSIIAARPRVGKTALALNVMVHAFRQGHAVAMYSLEMSRKQLIDRIAAQAARVAYGKIHRNETTPEEKAAICTALAGFTSKRFNIYDNVRSASAIVDETERTRPDIIFIDYAQKIVPDKYHDNRHREIEQIMSRLKPLAVDANCHICLLSQISRDGRDKPKLENLKESGSLEEGGDIVFLTHRETSTDGKTLGPRASLIIAKNKYGEEGEIPMRWNGQYQQFSED